MDAKAIWDEVVGELQLQVPKPSYETWLRGTTGVYIDDQVLTVRTPNAFVSEMLDTRMYSLISRCLEGQTGKPLRCAFKWLRARGVSSLFLFSLHRLPPVARSSLSREGEESPEPRGWDALSTRELGEWLVRHGHGWGSGSRRRTTETTSSRLSTFEGTAALAPHHRMHSASIGARSSTRCGSMPTSVRRPISSSTWRSDAPRATSRTG